MDIVTLKFWHGGVFKLESTIDYVGGELWELHRVDVDELCTFWIEELGKINGIYNEIAGVWYKDGEGVYNKVVDDEDVHIIYGMAKRDGYATFWVEHVVQMGQLLLTQFPQNEPSPTHDNAQTIHTQTQASPPHNTATPTTSEHSPPTEHNLPENSPATQLSQPPPRQQSQNNATQPKHKAQKKHRAQPQPRHEFQSEVSPPSPKDPSQSDAVPDHVTIETLLQNQKNQGKKFTPRKHVVQPERIHLGHYGDDMPWHERANLSDKSTLDSHDSDDSVEDENYKPPNERESGSEVDSEKEKRKRSAKGRAKGKEKGSSSEKRVGKGKEKGSSIDKRAGKGSSSVIDKGKGVAIERESDFEEEKSENEDVPPLNSEEDDEEWSRSRITLEQWDKKVKAIAKTLINRVKSKVSKSKKSEAPVCESEYSTTDEDIATPVESEEEEGGSQSKPHKPVVFGKHTDFKKLIWEVGTRFPNRSSFRRAVQRYALSQGKNLKFNVSDNTRNKRLGARCVKNCPFRIYGSWDQKTESFIVKSVNNSHNCKRNMVKNRQLKSETIADEFLPIFKAKPHWPAVEIVETIRETFKVLINRWVAYKAKVWAHKKLHGSMKDHYSKLGRYLAALKASSPTSVFELVCTEPPQTVSAGLVIRGLPIFQRMFVCFDALKNGLVAGCRPILCLDGCFLKTILGGMLLTAIGRDANDQMFPVAWGVVQGENNLSWEWFMSNLKRCINTSDGQGWTFISDQQKGLLNAVAKVFPKADQRNCARHIYSNWHKKWKGEELKILFWRAVRAYCIADFEEAVEEMRKLCLPAAEDFMRQDPNTFCRAFLNTSSKCDVIVNNMAETFNGFILQARAKHIIYMLEDIRSTLMERLVKKKAWINGYVGLICPRIQYKLEKEKDRAAYCQVMPSSATVFQVQDSLYCFVVNLETSSCTCNKWDLSGIPCSHGCAAIFFLGQQPEHFVHECYKKSTYLKAYEGSISPITGERHWPRVDRPIDPPPIKIGPRRPRRNRIKQPHEDPKQPGKLTRHGLQMNCRRCGQGGHNKKTCTNPERPQPEQQPPAKRGRPAKPALQQVDSHHSTVAAPAAGRKRSRGRERGGQSNVGRRRGNAGAGGGSTRAERGIARPGTEVVVGHVGLSSQVQSSTTIAPSQDQSSTQNL